MNFGKIKRLEKNAIEREHKIPESEKDTIIFGEIRHYIGHFLDYLGEIYDKRLSFFLH